MNEPVFTALQAHVDQMLAATPFFAHRKQQMRDELLGHLLCVYDEEFARSGDEAIAVAAAIHRFGIARELHHELETCVTIWERISYWILGHKEKIMWRLFLVLGAVAVLVGMAFVMPAVQQMLNEDVLTLSVVLLTLGSAMTLGGVWSFIHGVRRFRVRNV